MRSACLALLALATGGANGAQCPAVGTGWTTMTLDDSIGFKAYHKVEGDTLNLRLEAQSAGWLGFGIPEQTVGHMKGADMVIASVNQGKVTATDSHAKWGKQSPTPRPTPSAADASPCRSTKHWRLYARTPTLASSPATSWSPPPAPRKL